MGTTEWLDSTEKIMKKQVSPITKVRETLTKNEPNAYLIPKITSTN